MGSKGGGIGDGTLIVIGIIRLFRIDAMGSNDSDSGSSYLSRSSNDIDQQLRDDYYNFKGRYDEMTDN